MASRLPPSCLTFAATAPPFPDAAEQAAHVEAVVFRASFGQSAEALRSYYDEIVEQTAFVLAWDDGWAGMMRIGLPGPLPALSVEDAAGPPFHSDLERDLAAAHGAPVRLMDVLTTAVRARHRNRGIFDLMLAAAARLAAGQGCTHLVAMLDSRVVAFFQARGLPFVAHSAPHPYYGSPATVATSVPVGVLRAWLEGSAAA